MSSGLFLFYSKKEIFEKKMPHNVDALRVSRFASNGVFFLNITQTLGVVGVIGYFFFSVRFCDICSKACIKLYSLRAHICEKE